jgi:hypothetical protein
MILYPVVVPHGRLSKQQVASAALYRSTIFACQVKSTKASHVGFDVAIVKKMTSEILILPLASGSSMTQTVFRPDPVCVCRFSDI